MAKEAAEVFTAQSILLHFEELPDPRHLALFSVSWPLRRSRTKSPQFLSF